MVVKAAAASDPASGVSHRLGRRATIGVTVMLAASILLTATVTFAVQPAIAKALLPRVGGSASVWLVVMLVFQCSLLIGYLHASLLSSRASFVRQLVIQSVTLFVCGMIGLWQIGGLFVVSQPVSPIADLLYAMAVPVGLVVTPLFATGPLLQWWAADMLKLTHGYRLLYAVSNAGNLIGLIGYPVLIEPYVDLRAQLQAVPLSLLLLGSISLALLVIVRTSVLDTADRRSNTSAAAVAVGTALQWGLIAAVSSSLVLGVTRHITTDIAPVTLLWILPLALFVAVNVVAFSAAHAHGPARFEAMARVAVLCLLFVVLCDLRVHVVADITVQLIGVTLILLGLAARLAATAPPASQMMTFYVCIAVGGVIGSAFNSIVAPQVFSTILEYPIALVVAQFCLATDVLKARWRDVMPAIVTGGLTAALFAFRPLIDRFGESIGATGTAARVLLPVGIPLALLFRLHEKRGRQAMALCAMCLVVFSNDLGPSDVWHKRTFYNVLRVFGTADRGYALFSGRVLHGAAPGPDSQEPAFTYYEPAKELMDAYRGGRPTAVVGLGAGTLAAFLAPTERIVFFEIDQAVIELALSSGYFNYVSDAGRRDASVAVSLIDGRLGLAGQPDASYDVIIVDAFTSDAIPVHLLTREAVRMYLRKLTPGGALALHVSNRYLDLESVVGRLAQDLGVVALHRHGSGSPERRSIKSSWVLLAEPTDGTSPWRSLLNHADDGAALDRSPMAAAHSEDMALEGWDILSGISPGRVWTDTYSAPLSVLRSPER